MTLLQKVAGLARAELTTADLEGFFKQAGKREIPLYQLETEKLLTARFQIAAKDIKQLQRLCSQRGDQLKILEKSGGIWILKRLIHRPVLILGLLILSIFFLTLPTRILFIQVKGNETVEKARILEAAQRAGLEFGVSRKALASEKIKNSLLQQVPELRWAGVNTRGCTAAITVRERHREPGASSDREAYGIYACRDGVIESCTATKGQLLCKPGDAVKEGQLLLSGFLDSGSHFTAIHPEGEIYARTSRRLTAVIPENSLIKAEETAVKRHWSLVIGKKRINFPWNSGIWDTSCGRMYEEYCVTLPGGYVLPIALAADSYCLQPVTPLPRIPENAEKSLSELAEDLLSGQMISGTILSKAGEFLQEDEKLIHRGSYFCREMIGRSRQDKIGE